MKKQVDRTKIASLTLILLLAISAVIIALPIAVAQDDHEDKLYCMRA